MVDSLAGEAFGGNEDTCFACLLIEIFSSCSEISYDFVAIAFN